ncbi:alpha/beta hydrolase family protein [Hyphomonas pacifica]|nr:prolyl oligopeptidase family serine peptidase [Hyphomonas pacifica]
MRFIMNSIRTPLAAVAVAMGCMTIMAGGAQADVPRAQISTFVGFENLRSIGMSPDGRYISGILRDDSGDVLIVHDRETGKTWPVQRAREDQSLQLTFVMFKGNDRLLFGLQQKYEIVSGSGGGRLGRKAEDDGLFNYVSRVYASDLDGGNLISLYDPAEEQNFPRWLSANISNILRSDPDHVLMRTPSTGGVQLRRVNIRTGESDILEQGGMRTYEWVLDSELKPVLRQDMVSGGRGTAWLRKDGNGNWQEIARFRGASGANGAPEFSGLGRGTRPGTAIVSARPNNRDTNALYLYDATTGEYEKELYSNDTFDVFSVLRDPITDEVIAGCYNAYKYICMFDDPKQQALWNGLSQAVGEENEIYLASGGDLDKTFMILVIGPQEPGAYYIYNVETRELSFFQSRRMQADPALLPSKEIFDYVAEDGTRLWGYLTIPPGATKDTKNMPMITLPHGGPEGRDVWSGDPMSNYWASQGYLVFQPHFRGGAGTGRKWVEAGWGQWGQLIQSDINEGTRALIAAGRADPNRICIAGWSHGGYVAFTASFLNTDLYKCSMAGAGVSDLRKMQDWVREEQGGRQSMSYKYWANAIGDPNDDKGKLDTYSANRNADKVGMPLLIVHGENDTTVPVEQSLMMAKSLDKANVDYKIMILEDMDHYLRPDQGTEWGQILQASSQFFRENIGPGWEKE